jgi:hypothetical protein
MAKIIVKGTIRLWSYYEVELPMTEDEFDSLSKTKQNELIEEYIDWDSVLESSEADSIYVDDLVKIEDEEN